MIKNRTKLIKHPWQGIKTAPKQTSFGVCIFVCSDQIIFARKPSTID
jgi:hypothetical protein